MGSRFSAPVKLRSERTTRGILALFLVIGVLAAITITGSGIAGAADLTFGGYSPYVAHGGADINYDGVVNGLDDSTNFFVDTELIDGYLDCDAWVDINTGEDGSGTIDDGDDCILQGYLTDDVETFIHVVDGFFAYTSTTETGVKSPISDAGWKLPWAYDSGTTFDLTSTDYELADWAWVVEAGFVDYDHDGTTNETSPGDDDATDFLPLGIDVEAGYVDVDNDGTVNDSGDDCSDECFFGLDVNNGKVQSGTVVNPFTANAGPAGPAGPAGVSGRIAISDSSSTNSLNKSKSAVCSGTTKVLGGGYTLSGTTETLKHLTVVSNGPAGGTAWRVRVIEATPTSGTWAVTVTAICATA